MSEAAAGIRYGWLKAIYLFNVIIVLPIGLAIVFAPATMMEVFETPGVDPVLFGYSGSVATGFGVCAIIGLRHPLRMVPILLLQLVYKLFYLLGVLLPLAVAGRLPESAAPDVVIFSLLVVALIIGIPFRHLLETSAEVSASPS